LRSDGARGGGTKAAAAAAVERCSFEAGAAQTPTKEDSTGSGGGVLTRTGEAEGCKEGGGVGNDGGGCCG